MTEILIDLISYLYPDPPYGLLVLGNNPPPIPTARTPEAVAAIAEVQRHNRTNDYDLSGLCEFHIGIIYARWGDFTDARQQFVLARRQWKFLQKQTAVSPPPPTTGSVPEPDSIKAICLTYFAEGYAQEAAFLYGEAISAYRTAKQCLQKTENCLPGTMRSPQKIRQCSFREKLAEELEKRLTYADEQSLAVLKINTSAQQQQILQQLEQVQQQQKTQQQQHLQQLTQLKHQQETQRQQHRQQVGDLQQQQKTQQQQHRQQVKQLQQQRKTLLQQMGQLQEQLEQLQQSHSHTTAKQDHEPPQSVPALEMHSPLSPTSKYRNNEHHQWYRVHTFVKNNLFPSINVDTYVLIDTTDTSTYEKDKWVLVKNGQQSNDVITLVPYPPTHTSKDRELNTHPRRIQLCHLGRVTRPGKFERNTFNGKIQFSKNLKNGAIQYPDIIGIVIGIWYKQQMQ